MKKRANFLGSCKKFLKENYKTIILIVGMTILSLGMIALRLREVGVSLHSKRAIAIYVGIMVITILIATIFYFAKRKTWKIEKVYLFFGLIFGTLFCFFMPVGTAPDEHSHFVRTYQITNEVFFQKDNSSDFPVNIVDVVLANKGDDAYRDMLSNINEQPSSTLKHLDPPAYAVFNYIPQSIGVTIGRIFHAPIIVIVLIGRVLNMLFCTLIIYFCIKYIPVFKKMLFLIALFPMTLQLFASVSADGSIICAAMALIAYVLYARNGMKRKMGIWDFLLLLLICLTLTITKPMYAFLCPIVFWIPKERFKNNKIKISFIFLLGGVTLAFVLAKMMSGGGSASVGRYGSTESQVALLIHQPLSFVWLVFKNMINSFDFYWTSIIGESLGWFKINVFSPYILMFLFLFGLLCMERKTSVPIGLRLYSCLAWVAVVVASFVMMFLVWSVPGSDVIEGVQGRYFLPALLLIPLICLPSDKKVRGKELVKTEYLYPLVGLVDVFVVGMIIASHIA